MTIFGGVFFGGEFFLGSQVSGNFFGGSFFGSGFFGDVPTETTGGAGGRKKRWVEIEDRLYHATDRELHELLNQPRQAPVAERPKAQAIAKVEAKVQREIRPDVRADDDDEDDIEILLWH